MATFVLVVQDNRSATQIAREIDKADKNKAAKSIQNYLKRVFSGFGNAFVTSQVEGAFAVGYVDCDNSDAVNGTDELVVGGATGATLAVEASPATQSEFAKGASDATMATALAACINAHTTLSKLVRAYIATSPTNRVHIVARVPGITGNLITLSETGNGFTLSAAALAGGTSDEVDSFAFGYDPRV